jgi:hypothetical protein|tara:strand:- start:114 stop:302 length:189 start_codon:yes stop_codon:yes gene_type:complete
MWCIARHINGISINGDEYILDENNDLKTFENQEDALSFIGVEDIDELEGSGIFLVSEEEANG